MKDTSLKIGRYPEYLKKNLDFFLSQPCKNKSVKALKINRDAPLRFKVLCSFEEDWTEDFKPCSDLRFKPIFDM